MEGNRIHRCSMCPPHTQSEKVEPSLNQCWQVPARHWDAHRRQCALENRDKLEHLSSPSPGEHDCAGGGGGEHDDNGDGGGEEFGDDREQRQV